MGRPSQDFCLSHGLAWPYVPGELRWQTVESEGMEEMIEIRDLPAEKVGGGEWQAGLHMDLAQDMEHCLTGSDHQSTDQ